MSGGDELRTKLVRTVNEPAKLQVLVTHHTGIRRAAGFVFVGKILDDVLLKIRRLVHEIIRDVELVADTAGVGHGLRTTAFVLRAIHAILRPKLERDANDVVALFDEQGGGGGGINSSTHATHDALTLLQSHSRTLYAETAPCKTVCIERNFILPFQQQEIPLPQCQELIPVLVGQ